MSLSLPRPLPLPASLPLPICSALLCSALSSGFVTLALLLLFWLLIGIERGCGQGSLVVGQVQVAMENGNCDCDYNSDGDGDGDRVSLSLSLSALESASFGFSRSSTVDGGVDVIRFLESNSYSHPAENSHIAFTVRAFSDDVPFRTTHSSNSNWN